jgi:predicted RNase H-like nuclease (RuvC/YqgF family)
LFDVQNVEKVDIKRGVLGEHENQACTQALVLCGASDYKCTWVGTRKQLDEHSAQCKFQQIRPALLNETFQYQKQFDEYKFYFNKQQNEINELKNQIEQYDNRIDKLQKGFKEFLEVSFQQKVRYEKFYNDIQEIYERFNQENN